MSDDVDTCDMPLGDGRRCTLPGDHDGGCVVLEPNCACGHVAFRHIADRYRCRKPGCGCMRFRTKETAA